MAIEAIYVMGAIGTKGADMNKIIVTGATSMIGVATIEAAISHDVEVYAVVRPKTKRLDRLSASSLVHIIEGGALDTLLQVDGLPQDADVLYHFAWAGTNKEQRDDPTVQEKNIGYTLDAVELAKRCGCRRFVGAGSQAEYGSIVGVIDEETRFKPEMSYGISKYAAGILSRKLCSINGIEHVWGRIFSVYGPNDNEGTMLDYAISCFDRGETAHFSASIQPWNYLYESDAGEMFYRMACENVPEGTYLVASDLSKSLKEYIQILLDEYGQGVNAEFARVGESVPAGLNVNNEKTLDILDYKPKVGFEEGIRNMIHAKTTRRENGFKELVE